MAMASFGAAATRLASPIVGPSDTRTPTISSVVAPAAEARSTASRSEGVAAPTARSARQANEQLDLGAQLRQSIRTHRRRQHPPEGRLVVERQPAQEIFCRVHERHATSVCRSRIPSTG